MISSRQAKTYYRLTKPGIIRGNLVTAAAGFLLASDGKIEVSKLVAVLVGLSFIIAASCVVNNFIDRDIDRKMERTRNRALVTGEIGSKNAFLIATILGLLGAGALGLFTNLLTLYLALIGAFFYIVVYGVAKRLSPIGTLVGSISGAIPPVAGYAAASANLDLAAGLFFLIMVLWQMPHFYSIAIYRLNDYRQAGIPVLPSVKGIAVTKKHILWYAQVYLFATLSLSVFGYTGYVYFAGAAILGILWIWQGVRGFQSNNDIKWAKGMFRYSLLALSALCLLIYIDPLLP